MLIVFSGSLSILTGRDNGLGPLVSQEFEKGIRIVASVCDEIIWCETIDQVIYLRDIVTLASCKQKAQRIAQTIDNNVDLGAEATTAPA